MLGWEDMPCYTRRLGRVSVHSQPARKKYYLQVAENYAPPHALYLQLPARLPCHYIHIKPIHLSDGSGVTTGTLSQAEHLGFLPCFAETLCPAINATDTTSSARCVRLATFGTSQCFPRIPLGMLGRLRKLVEKRVQGDARTRWQRGEQYNWLPARLRLSVSLCLCSCPSALYQHPAVVLQQGLLSILPDSRPI